MYVDSIGFETGVQKVTCQHASASAVHLRAAMATCAAGLPTLGRYVSHATREVSAEQLRRPGAPPAARFRGACFLCRRSARGRAGCRRCSASSTEVPRAESSGASPAAAAVSAGLLAFTTKNHSEAVQHFTTALGASPRGLHGRPCTLRLSHRCFRCCQERHQLRTRPELRSTTEPVRSPPWPASTTRQQTCAKRAYSPMCAAQLALRRTTGLAL